MCSEAALDPVLGSELQPTSASWPAEVQELEKGFSGFDRSRGAIVFIGSSSIRRWTTLVQDFPELPVINNGFGGSQIIDSAYYADRLVIPLTPHTVVMYSGSNDINVQKSPQQVLADFTVFVKRVHAALPDTRIFFISLSTSPSRWSQREQVKEANRLIRAYTDTDERLRFIDLYTPVLGVFGTPVPELYVPDRLHLSPIGYALWRDIVGAYLYAEDGRVSDQALAAIVAKHRATWVSQDVSNSLSFAGLDWIPFCDSWQVNDEGLSNDTTDVINTNAYTVLHQAGERLTYTWTISLRCTTSMTDGPMAGVHVLSDNPTDPYRGSSLLIWQDRDSIRIYNSVNGFVPAGNRLDVQGVGASVGETHSYRLLVDGRRGELSLYRDDQYVVTWQPPDAIIAGGFASLRTRATRVTFEAFSYASA